MDTLVFRKFDLKRRSIHEEVKDKIPQLRGGGELRIYSELDSHVGAKILIQSAEQIIQALLNTYEEVGQLTGEDMVLTRADEILQSMNQVASEESRRVLIDVRSLRGYDFSPDAQSKVETFSSNFLTDARAQAEVLIEIYRRKKKNIEPKTSWTNEVFVIMQIGNPELDKIWQSVYMPVIGDLKMKPCRIDKHNEGRFLMSEVVDFLNRSRLIIADLTNERPNCYLEIGYALGIEKYNQLILCAREDHHQDSPNYKKGGLKIHFDINGYDILFWNSTQIDDFKISLAKKIQYRLAVSNKNGGVLQNNNK